MADYNDATLNIPTLIWLLFFRSKCAPQLHRRAERGEEVAGDIYPGDLLCAVFRGKRRRTNIVRSQTGEAPRLRAPRQEIGIRHWSFRDAIALVALPELDEPIRFMIRQRT